MQGKVEICGVNTAKLQVLKNEEMTELLKRVKCGDQEARQKMIEGNLRLVLSVIQRFAMRDVAYKVLKTRENYLREHQKEPSIEEIAKQLELRREEIVFALDAISDPISLYEPIYSDGSDAICVMDQVRDDKNCDEQWLNHLALREAMGQLGERELRYLVWRRMP